MTELITINEFCVMAHMGKTTAYKEINSLRLPAVKVGNKTLIRKDDAVAWLDTLGRYVPRILGGSHEQQ